MSAAAATTCTATTSAAPSADTAGGSTATTADCQSASASPPAPHPSPLSFAEDLLRSKCLLVRPLSSSSSSSPPPPALFDITEVELYHYHATTHPDPFVHRHREQQGLLPAASTSGPSGASSSSPAPATLLSTSTFYFHRSGHKPGAKFKGGTYKGLDIAFGGPHWPAVGAGGVLLRGLRRRDAASAGGAVHAAPVDGPCRSVDALLAAAGATTIEDLVRHLPPSRQAWHGSDTSAQPVLALVDAPPSTSAHGQPSIHHGPRVGLTTKRARTDSERRVFADYLARPYRLVLDPKVTKKARASLQARPHKRKAQDGDAGSHPISAAAKARRPNPNPNHSVEPE